MSDARSTRPPSGQRTQRVTPPRPTSHDHTLHLWDSHDGHHLATWVGHTRGIIALSTIDDRALRLWDVTTGHCLRVHTLIDSDHLSSAPDGTPTMTALEARGPLPT